MDVLATSCITDGVVLRILPFTAWQREPGDQSRSFLQAHAAHARSYMLSPLRGDRMSRRSSREATAKARQGSLGVVDSVLIFVKRLRTPSLVLYRTNPASPNLCCVPSRGHHGDFRRSQLFRADKFPLSHANGSDQAASAELEQVARCLGGSVVSND